MRFRRNACYVNERKTCCTKHKSKAYTGEWTRLALQLLAERADVVLVDVRVAHLVHQLARLKAANLRHQAAPRGRSGEKAPGWPWRSKMQARKRPAAPKFVAPRPRDGGGAREPKSFRPAADCRSTANDGMLIRRRHPVSTKTCIRERPNLEENSRFGGTRI